MPDTENEGNAAQMIALAKAGVPFVVTADGQLIVHAAEQHTEQPAATKPQAKTTPAKPKREMSPEWKRTLGNKKAFKAMKGNELPATLHGKTSYTQKEAIAAGLLTPITRKPTAKAGRTNKTVDADVELTPEAYAYLKANAPELLV
tara:strand:+ start:99 stop:536 length:438 start_codon:yes stop_codon:yes gene_type:complete